MAITIQKLYGKFLDACEGVADEVGTVLDNLGMGDFAHNGPGMISYYAKLWREAGKPVDSQLGTASLERGLENTKMTMQLVGISSPLWEERIQNLIDMASEFKAELG